MMATCCSKSLHPLNLILAICTAHARTHSSHTHTDYNYTHALLASPTVKAHSPVLTCWR